MTSQPRRISSGADGAGGSAGSGGRGGAGVCGAFGERLGTCRGSEGRFRQAREAAAGGISVATGQITSDGERRGGLERLPEAAK